METKDWLWILHPALAVVVIYPLLGIVLRLSLQTRERRTRRASKLPASVGREHTDLGHWLAAGVVAIILIALAVVIATKQADAGYAAGAAHLSLLLLVWLGTATALVALWRARRPLYRASFALLCWLGLIGLGLQPEVWRLSDNPLDPAFWQSHFWGGTGLAGLMLFSIASRPEIVRQLTWRRLHIAANSLAALIFLAQGISGARDLLEIPLSWQAGLLGACNWAERTCPDPASVPPPAP
ncbi:DUF4079 domain-containing protein [Synechococcus sp. RSCCF101]|uniref:DUF4079 domain-containing protein n=1 Tax=Synechococcus sp. RSCCF101 TaxID=2511069 RepID=UPI001244609D|nr:DUF4079 domain-containing protein [Synechococcus sp. RSCCF101]QEY31209.1 DUF4079 domain-containing protein [Synechococcus sp. RSCCF101]